MESLVGIAYKARTWRGNRSSAFLRALRVDLRNRHCAGDDLCTLFVQGRAQAQVFGLQRDALLVVLGIHGTKTLRIELTQRRDSEPLKGSQVLRRKRAPSTKAFLFLIILFLLLALVESLHLLSELVHI